MQLLFGVVVVVVVVVVVFHEFGIFVVTRHNYQLAPCNSCFVLLSSKNLAPPRVQISKHKKIFTTPAKETSATTTMLHLRIMLVFSSDKHK